MGSKVVRLDRQAILRAVPGATSKTYGRGPGGGPQIQNNFKVYYDKLTEQVEGNVAKELEGISRQHLEHLFRSIDEFLQYGAGGNTTGQWPLFISRREGSTYKGLRIPGIPSDSFQSPTWRKLSDYDTERYGSYVEAGHIHDNPFWRKEWYTANSPFDVSNQLQNLFRKAIGGGAPVAYSTVSKPKPSRNKKRTRYDISLNVEANVDESVSALIGRPFVLAARDSGLASLGQLNLGVGKSRDTFDRAVYPESTRPALGPIAERMGKQLRRALQQPGIKRGI